MISFRLRCTATKLGPKKFSASRALAETPQKDQLADRLTVDEFAAGTLDVREKRGQKPIETSNAAPRCPSDKRRNQLEKHLLARVGRKNASCSSIDSRPPDLNIWLIDLGIPRAPHSISIDSRSGIATSERMGNGLPGSVTMNRLCRVIRRFDEPASFNVGNEFRALWAR